MNHLLHLTVSAAFLLAMSMAGIAHAQQPFAFTLSVGTYTNDHAAREFHADEREWKLEKGRLSYSIDAHDSRYVDTLALTGEDIDSLRGLILKGHLNQNLESRLQSSYADKWEYSREIKLEVTLQGKHTILDLRGKGYTALNEEPLALAVDELEQLLWRILERTK